MIQFNNVSPFGAGNPGDISIGGQQKQSAIASFENELSAALTATLAKFGIDPSKISISIGPASTSATAASSASASNPSTSKASASNAASHASASSAVASDNADNPDAIKAFDDRYWASQPAAVRALRDIDDIDKRSEMAGQLAASGYSIDVPVMVWGWDPSKVTDIRHGFGYTWIPSAFMTPIQEAPGINDMGGTPYDPNNPPPGAIMV